MHYVQLCNLLNLTTCCQCHALFCLLRFVELPPQSNPVLQTALRAAGIPEHKRLPPASYERLYNRWVSDILFTNFPELIDLLPSIRAKTLEDYRNASARLRDTWERKHSQ